MRGGREFMKKPFFKGVLLTLLVAAMVFSLSSLASAEDYYYKLTGISSGSCGGSAGAVQIMDVAITRIAYLPAGDVESWEMLSSTGGFASGGGSGTFSVGPTGPGATGTFRSGITTTAGTEPVTATARVTSNITGKTSTLVVRCNSATDVPVVTISGYETIVPAMNAWGMLVFVILAGAGALYFIKRRKAAF